MNQQCHNAHTMHTKCTYNAFTMHSQCRWFTTTSLLHPDVNRCVGINLKANLLLRALDASLIHHEMSCDEKRAIWWNWRSITNGFASPGPDGYYLPLQWLNKKIANFIHEFNNEHITSLPCSRYPRLQLDRRLKKNIHGSLPASTVDCLLSKLVFQRSSSGPSAGHYKIYKLLKLTHEHFPGKQYIRAQPLPCDKFQE